jgi:hypothetical protein
MADLRDHRLGELAPWRHPAPSCVCAELALRGSGALDRFVAIAQQLGPEAQM